MVFVSEWWGGVGFGGVLHESRDDRRNDAGAEPVESVVGVDLLVP